MPLLRQKLLPVVFTKTDIFFKLCLKRPQASKLQQYLHNWGRKPPCNSKQSHPRKLHPPSSLVSPRSSLLGVELGHPPYCSAAPKLAPDYCCSPAPGALFLSWPCNPPTGELSAVLIAYSLDSGHAWKVHSYRFHTDLVCMEHSHTHQECCFHSGKHVIISARGLNVQSLSFPCCYICFFQTLTLMLSYVAAALSASLSWSLKANPVSTSPGDIH